MVREMGAQENFSVTQLKMDDVAEVLAFIREQYGEHYFGAKERFFRWLFVEVPCKWFAARASEGFIPANGILGKSGEILALHVFIPFDAQTPWGGTKGIFDEEWINGSGIRGLGRALVNYLLSIVDVYCGYGCNDLSEKAFLKMGFTFHQELPRLVAILDRERLSTLVAESGYIEEAARLPESVSAVPQTSWYALPSASAAPLKTLEDYNASVSFGVKRSSEWLAWRYDKHPYLAYHAVSDSNDGSSGVAVIRLENVAESPVCVARIVDLIATPENEAGILRAAMAFASDSNCILIDLMTSSWQLSDRLQASMSTSGVRLLTNPRVPYMFQPCTFGKHDNVNFAIHSHSPADMFSFRAFKADGTQDILRSADSAAILKRK